jgi:hypothetical protein
MIYSCLVAGYMFQFLTPEMTHGMIAVALNFCNGFSCIHWNELSPMKTGLYNIALLRINSLECS